MLSRKQVLMIVLLAQKRRCQRSLYRAQFQATAPRARPVRGLRSPRHTDTPLTLTHPTAAMFDGVNHPQSVVCGDPLILTLITSTALVPYRTYKQFSYYEDCTIAVFLLRNWRRAR